MANIGISLKDLEITIKDLNERMVVMPPSFIASIPKLERPQESPLFASLGHIPGMPVIVSEHAYITKTAVKGTPDKRRPNTRRPLYRRKTWREGVAFMINESSFRLKIKPNVLEDGNFVRFRFSARLFQESLNKSAISIITGISGS